MTGEELRHWLAATYQPQRPFAQRMGIHYATLKRWMAGTAPIPYHTAIVLVALREGRLSQQWIDANVPLAGLEKSHQ